MLVLVRGIPGYDPFKGSEGCWFDEEAAQFAIDFFAEMLVHIEGAVAGKAFVLEPWQAAVVANLFGWKKLKDGREARRYRELFFYVPRKNGKTPFCAGIGLYLFFVDDEAGQQDYIAASETEQAGLLFRHMQQMVERNKGLKKRCSIFGGDSPKSQTRSFNKPDGSYLKVISGKGGGKHGGNPHLVIIDELHEQEDPDLVDALTTSMVSSNRPQSLFIQLTTADHDRTSVCNDKYDFALKVRDDPSLDPSLLPVIYEALPTDDPYDPKTWRKANPNLGVSVSEEELHRLAARAKLNPSFDVEFKRLHLNLRTRKHVANAIDMGLWDAAGEPLDHSALAGQPCWAGLDFGWRNDYAALVVIFPGTDGLVRMLAWFWLPGESDRDKRAEPTARFVAAEHVAITSGNATDMEAIYATLREIRVTYALQSVTIDPSNAAKQGQDLMSEGFDVVEFTQNKRNYTEPWKWLMSEGLANCSFRHGGNPVMRWMAGNVAVEVDGIDQVMPKKKRSLEKIDGICALGMALGAWLRSKATDDTISPEIQTL